MFWASLSNSNKGMKRYSQPGRYFYDLNSTHLQYTSEIRSYFFCSTYFHGSMEDFKEFVHVIMPGGVSWNERGS